jgi:hypothetical protein
MPFDGSNHGLDSFRSTFKTYIFPLPCISRDLLAWAFRTKENIFRGSKIGERLSIKEDTKDFLEDDDK